MKEKKNEVSPFSIMENEVLVFWEKNKIFEKSVNKEAQNGDYVFYDGPPFATGTPHYGHIVGSIMKDVIPRYWTMNGKKVERKWGWDCHGLPIENIVEKELGSKSKKDIEETGVAKFNELCRSKVLSYVNEWEKVIKRLGRWADMKNAYRTMDLDYMESIWWVFKELWNKGLIYEGYKSMHVCPRCETTLSQQEVSEGYADIKDLSAIAKFELDDGMVDFKKYLFEGEDLLQDDKIYVLAWTTTPWTLIGNVALAAGKDIKYSIVQKSGIMVNDVKFEENQETGPLHDGYYIVAEDRARDVIINYKEPDSLKVVGSISGKDLIGKKYRPLFNYYASDNKLENHKNGWKIYHGDFVSTEEGTGVVHIAPAFGEDDMKLGKEYNLPFIQHLTMDGNFKPEVKDFVGLNVKPKGDHMSTDIEIIKYLSHNNLLFHKEKYEHSYPHCWRCDTPLINYATSSWFVNVVKIKEKILETAKEINWSPAHIKEGRFGKWLEGARDWSISRQRFWASVMPIWKCNKCGEMKVFGSVAELEKASGQKIDDLHKHIVDEINFSCDKCNGEMTRIPDVLDTWFDSGSMPYAQMHYPFENRKKFENNFPAEFIAEGQDQTRAWFYYLHVIGTAIKDSHAFNNVIVNGIVLAEDGKKMAKRLKNYPDPSLLFDQYGADALRYYLMTSHIVQADNLNFSEEGVKEALRKVIMILWNVYKFYELFSDESKVYEVKKVESNNILDKWILARLNQLIVETTEGMNNYNLPAASRPISKFIDDLSTWYIRRSRDRFKGDDVEDKKAALETTKYVLIQLSKIMAPFTPFISENVWQRAVGINYRDADRSVHLEPWPQTRSENKEDESKILDEMENVRKIVERGLAKRDEAGIKVRQPLGELRIKNYELRPEYKVLVLDELNIKEIIAEKGEGDIEVNLDLEITPELKQEGIKRELVRSINNIRKNEGLTINDRIEINWRGSEESRNVIDKFREEILKETLSDEIIEKKNIENSKEIKIDGEVFELNINKL